MAELLLGQPLFPGDSGVDQLVEIIKVRDNDFRTLVSTAERRPCSSCFSCWWYRANLDHALSEQCTEMTCSTSGAGHAVAGGDPCDEPQLHGVQVPRHSGAPLVQGLQQAPARRRRRPGAAACRLVVWQLHMPPCLQPGMPRTPCGITSLTLKARQPCATVLAASHGGKHLNKQAPVLRPQVAKLLQYSPRARLSALEALGHPYFDELRDSSTRLPNGALAAGFCKRRPVDQPWLHPLLRLRVPSL